MKKIAQVIETLSSDFSKLEALCARSKSGEVEPLLKEMARFMERSLAGESSKSIQELLSDLQVRVATWRDVWPRLGKDPQFRNAVARESHAWSQKLLKLAK